MRRPPRTAQARTAQAVRDDVRERRRYPRDRGSTLPDAAPVEGDGGGCCFAWSVFTVAGDEWANAGTDASEGLVAPTPGYVGES